MLAIPTLFAISILSFVVMHLPPGDFLTTYAATLQAQGEGIYAEQLEQLRQAYGMGQPIYVQYWKWMSNIVLHGDFGLSLNWRLPGAPPLLGRPCWTCRITPT